MKIVTSVFGIIVAVLLLKFGVMRLLLALFMQAITKEKPEFTDAVMRLVVSEVFFQDVFAEPEGNHSIDGVWRASYSTFVGTKYWCYRILTAIFGIPTAILCGCYFACLSFDYIWCIMPCLRGYLIELQCLSKVFTLVVRSFCDPLFDSIGRIFGGIKVTNVNHQTVNA